MNIGGFLKRNALSIVLLGSFSGCTGVVLNGAFQHAIFGARRQICQSNLKSIALACQLYQADYGGNFPPLSDGSSRGWTSLLTSYNRELNFSCPAGYKSSFSPSSDYFFNAQLAKRKSSSVRDPIFTVAFGDGMDNGASNSHYYELPNDWNNQDSPQQRHWGANYAFADGHVKMLSVKGLREWVDYADSEKEARVEFTRQVHYKFSPDESAIQSKIKPKASKTSPDSQQKRLKDLVHAARSFPSSKRK